MVLCRHQPPAMHKGAHAMDSQLLSTNIACACQCVHTCMRVYVCLYARVRMSVYVCVLTQMDTRVCMCVRAHMF